jgi:hypothetical protein
MATIRQPLQNSAMNYTDCARPWCVICLQPNLHHHVLNRFQRRHEAEAHLKVLRQMSPSGSYTVMFDSLPESAETYLTTRWQHS